MLREYAREKEKNCKTERDKIKDKEENLKTGRETVKARIDRNLKIGREIK